MTNAVDVKSASEIAMSRSAAILAIGFGAAVSMWAIGYVLHLPGVHAPSQLVFGLLIVALLGAGFVAGRGGLSLPTTVLGGAVAGAINLLIVGSLLGGKNRDQLLPRELLQSAAIWSVSTIVICALGVGLGRMLASGMAIRRHAARELNWTFRFGLVACFGTLVLISVGGAVTGFDAGLAVPDWPNTYGYNMFLYPLSKMTGGIYFEHSHRLFGALVGLTMLTLTAHLLFTERRRGVKIAAGALLLIVISQGILGALRVTGKLTLSQDRNELAPNVALAVVHGVLAQVFLCGLLALTASLSTRWRGSANAVSHESAATDRGLGFACIALVLTQLIFGALLRHFTWGLQFHLGMAAVVVLALGAFAIRVWSLYEIAPLSRIGATLIGLLLAQLLMGFGALAATYIDGSNGTHPLQVLVTTLHQTTGAMVLGLTVLSVAWHLRLVRPIRQRADESMRVAANPE